MSQIDLSQLPPPDVVQRLDFESFYQEKLAEFKALYPEWSAVIESDPAVKLLELAGYRETLLRGHTNDVAQACMLAYAVGTDLENLAALLGVQRLVVDPGDPEADPPVPPTYEADDRLRQRAQMAMEGTTVAGSYGAYTFHALSASARVKDVAVDSPAPGDVRITLLATDNNGLADAELLTTVGSYLSAAERRPLTDTVIVEPATLVDFEVVATLHLYPGPSGAPVLANAQAALEAYLAGAARIGYDITRSGLFAALHQPGVQNVAITSPAADIVNAWNQAPNCTGITVTIGGTGD